MMTEASLNDYVWVQLTEHGLGVYHDHYVALFPNRDLIPIPALHTRRGWTRFQLWELMHIFGADTMMGGPLSFKSTAVRLEDKGEK